MKLAEAVQRYYVRCRAAGIRDTTITTYGYLYRHWLYYCTEHGLEDVEDVMADDLREYFISLRGQYSPATIQDIYRSLTALWNWWEREEIVKTNCIRKVERPRKQQERGRVFTGQEVDTIMDYWDRAEFVGLRNYTIMALLLGTGIRKAELLQLRTDDIDTDGDTITVYGKGGKYRDVPISHKLRKIIVNYLRARENYTGRSGGWLIVSKDGGRLTVSGLNKVFQELKDNTGIPPRKLSPHTMRRTYATAFLTNGGNLFILQEILGHSDIATTRIYANFTAETRKQQQNDYSPLDNRRWKN